VAGEPLTPTEQAEVDTILGIVKTIRKRGTYTTPFSEAVQSLNAECARIFRSGPEDSRVVEPKDWA
jgi:hypothetical protein